MAPLLDCVAEKRIKMNSRNISFSEFLNASGNWDSLAVAPIFFKKEFYFRLEATSSDDISN